MTNNIDNIESDIKYNYTQFSQDKHVNVIPEQDFKQLITDTFSTMTQILRSTYGPYGSVIVISDQNETTTTKDGYNVCEAMGFSHIYKRMVYLAIKKICDRVNRNVGDGTTSCILLAEKIFNKLTETPMLPDEKRQILNVLSDIESYMQSSDVLKSDKELGIIEPLESVNSIINLAGNYDDKMTEILYDALNPVYDMDGYIASIRNVIPDGTVDRSIDSDVVYNIAYMPGKYRVRVNINPEIGLMFTEKSNIKLAIYDHVFNSTDWDHFMANYDKETPTLIMATGFNPLFKDNDYVRYCAQRQLCKAPVSVMICAIEGTFVQDEIADLCAVLNTNARKLKDVSDCDHSKFPTVSMNIYQGNAMCFYDVEPPEDYIKTLEYSLKNDTSKSTIKSQNYHDRLSSLRMETTDTLINVKASSSLELKMIMDKIDDCVSIIKSAFEYGIVPNMLNYAYHRINRYCFETNHQDEMSKQITSKIRYAIKGLFTDIWTSKYCNSDFDYTTMNDNCDEFYDGALSFDIVNEEFVHASELPTSAQYDTEVVAAAISIVKYLITSRALIFDAHLQKPVDDIDIMNSRL